MDCGRKRIRRSIIGLVATATIAVGAIVVAPATPAVSLPDRAQEMGIFPGYAATQAFQQLEAWLGHPIKHVVQFASQDAEDFTSSIYGQIADAGAWQTMAGRLTLVESIPLAFGPNGDARTASGQARNRTLLQATASGAHDGKYVQAARYLRDGGYGDAIVRLGWEYDGSWYPWSAMGNCDVFQDAYRRVRNLFRSVSGGFRFDLNGTGSFMSKPTGVACAWPGDAYVDIVGLDTYDKGYGFSLYDVVTDSWADPEYVFESRTLPRLQFQRDFAIAHGKTVSFPEWALVSGAAESLNNAGGDNPAFIQGMSDWMNSLPASGPGSLAYHGYYNADASHDGYHALSHFPKARTRFLQLFGATAPTTTTEPPAPTTTTQPPAPTTTTQPPATNTTAGQSDEFNGSSLADLWTYRNPMGDSNPWTISGNLTLIAVGGTPHDVAPSGDGSVGTSQPIGAGDFTVDTRFVSALDDDNTWQGITMDLGNGTTLRYAIQRVSGDNVVSMTRFSASGAQELSSTRVPGSSYVLRLVRTGSTLGASWSSTGGTFSAPTMVGGVGALRTLGPAVGNGAPADELPARLVGVIDYIRFAES
jgi:hypothetical protein